MSTTTGMWKLFLWVLPLLFPACAFATLTNVVTSNVFEDVYSVDWNYQDFYVAAGLKDNSASAEICIYRFTNNTLILRDIHPVTDNCNTVRWNPGTNVLAAGTGNATLGNLFLLSFTNSTSLIGMTNYAFADPVYAAAWRSNGTNLVIAKDSANPELWIYRYQTNRLTLVLSNDVAGSRTIYRNAMDWRKNDRVFALGMANDLSINPEVAAYDFNGSSVTVKDDASIVATHVTCVDWSQEGSLLAAGGTYASDPYRQLFVYSYNGTSLTQTTNLILHAGVLTVDWSPAGDFLSVGTEIAANEELRIYEYSRAGKSLRLLKAFEHNSSVHSVRWSSDGDYLAVGDDRDAVGGGLSVYKMLYSDLAVTKTASTNVVLAGQALDYKLYITNKGPDTASSAVLTDILSAEVGFVSATASVGTVSYTNGAVAFDLGDLTNLATVSASISVTVTPVAAGSIINTCSVQSMTADLVLSNNGAMAAVTVIYDDDGDGVRDDWDNCPTTYNPGQEDFDSDGVGDACDNCTFESNPGQEDTDGDSSFAGAPPYWLGDACDNCPTNWNYDQANNDFDEWGDVCDPDDDNDGLPDEWEYLYFTNTLIAVASEDSDVDGYSNFDEYIANTNPQDLNDYFQIESISNLQSRAVYVESVSSRVYRLLYSDTIMDPVTWATGHVLSGNGTVLALTNSSISTSRFYRVSVSTNW